MYINSNNKTKCLPANALLSTCDDVVVVVDDDDAACAGGGDGDCDKAPLTGAGTASLSHASLDTASVDATPAAFDVATTVALLAVDAARR